MQYQLALFIISILTVWFSTSLILKTVTSFAQTLKVSSFTMSFFILGLLTSLPELVIGSTAVYRGDADLMVGNLVGASLVIFLLVIPLLAITGGGVHLPKDFSRRNLILSLSVVIAPAILISDRQLSIWEGIFLIIIYLLLFILLGKEASMLQKIVGHIKSKTSHHTYRLPKLLLGMGLIFFASQQVVSSAEYFATYLGWSSFIVGLLIVSIGTNIPELSLIVASVIGKKKGVALADYIGSAAGNTLLIGIFSIANMRTIVLPNHATQRIVLTLVALALFYIFAKSRSILSRKEGFALFLLYVIFVVLEIISAGNP